MNEEQLKEFLSQKCLLNIATITSDGYPHVVPVWFDYEGKDFLVSTAKKSKKARNLAKISRVGFSIAEQGLPYDAVVGYGDVAITDDIDGALLLKLAKKYLPPEKVERYWKELMDDNGERVVIRITPRWMKSWADRSELAKS
ncbi:MAG: pyridoxamine 5'-phosphate oxidase family protein [Candidatus Sungbacteria bacterium]|uniref:Pyridoxamine 5'-phosphate oxidase family protein n=1 Tax=Candidatus Sungiibacteriota bacterium TaxID=2750080 RepID=A0A931SCS5_9BACT|nr:pyridoxamine 5'-phosphate oxidase family protein [Candidatus Sungbacteria bacterium]